MDVPRTAELAKAVAGAVPVDASTEVIHFYHAVEHMNVAPGAAHREEMIKTLLGDRQR
ncbi:hypothetical protein WME89_20420 [Sorangium sp. So ce321]|uniref:hypothetical protein n=1 Tax=Sorangium sp. So ce321 TaxID=3133300 RepID=UPI003F61FB0F